MESNQSTRHFLRTGFTFSVFWLGVSCGPLAAQSVSETQCLLEESSRIQPVRQVPIDHSWSGGTFDGGGGSDKIMMIGPEFILLRPEKYRSLEALNIKNGQFDTVIVDGTMILGNASDELEIVADWFDQIILDPMLTWQKVTDTAYSDQSFQTEVYDHRVTVRMAADVYVVDAPTTLTETDVGPLGSFVVQHSTGPTITPDTSTSLRPLPIELLWAETGLVTPSMEGVEPPFGRVTLNTRNQTPNAVIIDVKELLHQSGRHIFFEGDETDRLIIQQASCWRFSDIDENGQRTAVLIFDRENKLKLTADHQQFLFQRTRPFTQGFAEIPSYRHLSADSRYQLDTINLRNGGRDILIIRNDGHLQNNFPIIIDGDEGLDEIWIEGTSGWHLVHQDYGLVATIPSGSDTDVILAFAPGLKVGILPLPNFLNDPRLLALAAYPGTRNTPSETTCLFITRGGNVNFSANQLANKSSINLTNGIRNILRLSPDNLVKAGADVVIMGDADTDVILSDGMPEVVVAPSGSLIWQIDRGNGQTQTITATGIANIQYPASK